MAIFKLFTVVILGLVTGCASNTVKDTATTTPAVKGGVEAKDDGLATNQKLSPKQKQAASTMIDPKVMYLLLTAELAGQRNQYDVALEGYMQAAKRVDDPRISERAAKIALFLDDSKKADTAVDMWLKQDANNMDAQMLAAVAALRAGRKQPALEHLEVLLQRDKAGFDDTLLEIMKSLGQPQRIGFLSSVLNDLSAKHSDQAVIYFVQSLLAMQSKDSQLAASKLTRALELHPDWDKALVAQSQLALLNNDAAGAEKVLREAIKKYPADARFRRMLAQVYIKVEKFDEAMAEYQAILKASPDDGDSMFSLALLQLQLQKDEESQVYLEKLVGRPEWASQASYYLGKLAAKKGRMDKALVWFDGVTDGSVAFDAGLSAVAVLLEQQRFDDAHARLDKMQRDYPDQSVRLLAMRSEIYNDQKQYAKAYKLLTEALAKTPGQKELLYTRALLAERMDNLKGMEADLQMILSKYPDDVTTLNALGYTLVNKTNRLQEAERYLLKAIRLQPNVPVIVDSYGWLLFKQGRLADARDNLQRAYDKLPQAEIAGHLIEVLMKMKLQAEAKALLDKALAKDPADEYLLEVKRRLFTK